MAYDINSLKKAQSTNYRRNKKRLAVAGGIAGGVTGALGAAPKYRLRSGLKGAAAGAALGAGAVILNGVTTKRKQARYNERWAANHQPKRSFAGSTDAKPLTRMEQSAGYKLKNNAQKVKSEEDKISKKMNREKERAMEVAGMFRR